MFDDKWLITLGAAVQGELDRVSQTLTGRIRQLAERNATPLPQHIDEVAALAAKVKGHLRMDEGAGMTKEKKVQIRNSTVEFLVFTAQAQENGIDVRGED